jgi:hypothetical protein
MEHLNEKNNFLYLLLSLMALLFSSAVSDDFPGGVGEDIFSIVSVVMIVVSIKSLHLGLTLKRIVYTLAMMMGGSTLLWSYYPNRWTLLSILLILLLSFLGAFKLAVNQILFEGRGVDANKIIGSLSLYLLLGLIWTVIYMIILLFDPTSFNGIEVDGWRTIFSRVAYYSFVTLTTLGYGDISPSSHIAEFAVYMEAITGVFYMAIFVSSLVSLRSDDIEERLGK